MVDQVITIEMKPKSLGPSVRARISRVPSCTAVRAAVVTPIRA